MANLLKKMGNVMDISGANSAYHDIFSNAAVNPVVTELETSYTNKLWRVAILLHRTTHGPSDSSTGVKKKSIADPAKYDGNRKVKELKRTRLVKEKKNSSKLTAQFQVKGQDEINKIASQYKNIGNDVILYNLTSKPYERIIIQNRPSTVEFKGETSWAAIKSMGRNTPMYHYTGAEDIVQFNISWYATDEANPDEVINKCRFLETWTKANAYQAAPPVIRIQWGSGTSVTEGDMFKDQLFILTSATYTLKNFSDSIRVKSKGKLVKLVSKGLYPIVATQELIFKRVSATNLSYGDILPESKMNRTRGING